jgi:hypothetical protein
MWPAGEAATGRHAGHIIVPEPVDRYEVGGIAPMVSKTRSTWGLSYLVLGVNSAIKAPVTGLNGCAHCDQLVERGYITE